MRLSLALSKVSKKAGFTLYEVIVAVVIVGVAGAVAAPSLVGTQREESREAFSKIRSALVEAQTNANRESTNCTVLFTSGSGTYEISGTPAGCILEPFEIDTDVVSITKSDFSTAPTNITFSFKGTTGDASTLWITRKNFSNTPMQNLARCVVISPIGMIRTGINNNGNCENIENKRYDNS